MHIFDLIVNLAQHIVFNKVPGIIPGLLGTEPVVYLEFYEVCPVNPSFLKEKNSQKYIFAKLSVKIKEQHFKCLLTKRMQ